MSAMSSPLSAIQILGGAPVPTRPRLSLGGARYDGHRIAATQDAPIRRYRMSAAGAPAEPGFAVEPLTKVAETINAEARSTAVITFNRRGVTQEKCFAAMKERIPVALAVAPIAVIMHCMHMAPRG
jgi:hypothetical protein